ncbi:MAG: SixA phosphatase family protein [Candidatus Dadabacteria bacterium]
MYKLVAIIVAFFLVSCKTTTYYIVRHAEKEPLSMSADPGLTPEGEKQAKDLMFQLQDAKIRHVYSTNFTRTLATAEPTRDFFGLKINIYDPHNLEPFIEELKKINDGNVLVVSHSNVVDDIVNELTGEKKIAGDLDEKEYGVVYVVKKTGNHYTFTKVPLKKVIPR